MKGAESLTPIRTVIGATSPTAATGIVTLVTAHDRVGKGVAGVNSPL